MGDEQRRLPPGILVRFSFLAGDFLAPICADALGGFPTCAKCGVIPEFFYKLECPHYICSYCIVSTRSSYTCGIDGTRTEIPLPIRVQPTRNAQLKEATVNCPECSQPVMFEYIKAHINLNHPELWKQDKRDTKIKTQAPSTWMSTGGQKRSALPTQLSKGRGIPFVTPVTINGPAHVQPQPGHRSDTGTADLGGYPHTHQVDEWRRDFPAQQASRSNESADQDEVAEEYMDVTEGYLQSPIGAPIPDTKQQMTDISNSSACQYCRRTFCVEKLEATSGCSRSSPTEKTDDEAHQNVDGLPKTSECAYCLNSWDVHKIEKHVEKCGSLFEGFYQLFRREVRKHYAEYLEDGSGKARTSSEMDTATDGLLSESVGQKWFKLVMDALRKEHLSKPSQKIPEDFAGFKERIRNDEPLLSMCKGFLKQVVLEYHKEHSKDRRLQRKDGDDAFQGQEEKKSTHFSGAPSGDGLLPKKEDPQGSKECPYCSETWDHQDYDDHLESCAKEVMEATERSAHSRKDYDQQPCKDECFGNQEFGNNAEKGDKYNGAETTTDDDIEELKKKVEKLEGRLQALEQPLKRLIERLQQESHATKK